MNMLHEIFPQLVQPGVKRAPGIAGIRGGSDVIGQSLNPRQHCAVLVMLEPHSTNGRLTPSGTPVVRRATNTH